MVLALVDVEHFASVFRFADVEHFTGTDGTSAMRVILITNSFHFQHVFLADGFIATFIENDTRIVTVIDNGIAHQFGTLFPLASLAVLFRITGRHGLDQTYTVARFDVLFPWTDVHPTNQIGIAFHHHTVAIVAQPGRYTHAHSRPLVAGALGKPFHLEHTVVQPDFTIRKTGLAETGTGSHFVHLLAIHPQTGLHGIQIAIAPAPEMKAFHFGLSFQGSAFTGFQESFLALEFLDQRTITINQLYLIRYFFVLFVFILDFRFGMNDGLATLYPDIMGIDIDTGCLQIAI